MALEASMEMDNEEGDIRSWSHLWCLQELADGLGPNGAGVGEGHRATVRSIMLVYSL